MKLENKVVIITGASEGIGRATALALAQEGAAGAGGVPPSWRRWLAKLVELALNAWSANGRPNRICWRPGR
jgi:NAD(P)-dependent dehydrogenase (short-subunit alcohol dehydrogenase family)